MSGVAARSTNTESVFAALREILRRHSNNLTVSVDTADRFCLEAAPGSATLAAWGGRARLQTIPVAWVQRGKSGVTYHLMGLAGNASLMATLSDELKARMQGKTCFRFQRPDPALFAELDGTTAAAIAGFRRAGFIEA